MKKNLFPALACCSLLAAMQTQAQVITDWTFENLTAGQNLNPAPAIGSGNAVAIGMDNTYGTPGPSQNISDVLASALISSTGTGNEWRIRGGKIGTGLAANGWSSLAPIGTQGAEFTASTVGFTGIQVSFDVEMTGQAEANLEVLYSTDGITWNNAVISSVATAGATIKNNTTSANTVMGSYISLLPSAFNNSITVDLSGISAANNDANFGIQLVNASTGVDDTNAAGTPYNNSSGNWRFDNVQISGVAAAPEPSTLALAGLGLTALFGFRGLRNRNV